MKLVFSQLVGAALLHLATATPAFQESLGCNPSTHCPDKSLECVNCNPADDDCVVDNSLIGTCTDPFKVRCKRGRCKVREFSDNEAHKRCLEMHVPNKPSRRRLDKNDYVKACRVGEYTCWDGSCTYNRNECANHGGLKYENYRCDASICSSNIGSLPTCDFQESSSSVLGFSNRECGSSCDVIGDKMNVGACCPSTTSLSLSQFCESSDECTLENNVCVRSVSKSECVDCSFPAFEQSCSAWPADFLQEAESLCGKACDPLPAAGMCRHVDFEGIQELAEESESPVVGLRIPLNFVKTDESCCCSVQCQCFGDPHCTGFFGDAQTSRKESGDFVLLQEGAFSVSAKMGPPSGVVDELTFTVTERPGEVFKLNTVDCQNATHNIRHENGDFVAADNLPVSWNVYPTYNQNTEGIQTSALTDPTRYVIRDNYLGVNLNVRCILYKRENSREYLTRLDFALEHFVERDHENECCPAFTKTRENLLANGASGFCVDNAIIPGSDIDPLFASNGEPVPEEDGNPESRRLGVKVGKTGDAKAHTRSRLADFSLKQRHRQLQDDTYVAQITSVCQQYFVLVNNIGETPAPGFESMPNCINNVLDFGLIGLELVLSALNTVEVSTEDCVGSANDPNLLNYVLGDCGQSVELQGRKLNKDSGDFSDWETIRVFPAELSYCEDAVTVVLEQTSVEVDGETEFLNADEWGFRLQQCQPDPNLCGTCQAVYGVESLGLDVLNECKIYNLELGIFRSIFANMIREGVLGCGDNAKGTSDTQCLQDALGMSLNNA